MGGPAGDTLDLLARSRRGLSAVSYDEHESEVPRKSRPGEVDVVTVADGVARCTCTGFDYRGSCSHAKEAVKKLSGSG